MRTRKGKWFIGQRVRVIMAPAVPEAVGRAATITKFGPRGASNRRYDVSVLIDGMDGRAGGYDFSDFATFFYAIRPLDDPKPTFARFMRQIVQPVPLDSPGTVKPRKVKA